MRALSLRGAFLVRRATLVGVPALRAPRCGYACDTAAGGGAGGDATKPGADKKEPTAAKAAAAAAAAKGTAEEVVPADTVRRLEKELEQAKLTMDELRKDVLYRAADAENARRIGREDAEKARLYGVTNFAKDMLEVADTLEKAVEAFAKISEKQLAENASLNSLLTGVRLSLKVLLTNLEKNGVTKMNVQEGTVFDPNMHDALVRTAPSAKAPAETISHVMKSGYMLNNRVLRAAQVGVAHEAEA